MKASSSDKDADHDLFPRLRLNSINRKLTEISRRSSVIGVLVRSCHVIGVTRCPHVVTLTCDSCPVRPYSIR